MIIEKQLLTNKKDECISDEQLTAIRSLLIDMRDSVVAQKESKDAGFESERCSDDADKAGEETAWLVAVKKRASDNDLLSDIEKALYKMETGEYGYCERSGQPIEVARLLAYPTSRLSLEEQTRHEQQQQMRCRPGESVIEF